MTEPIAGLYERDRLAEALREARAHTLRIYGHLELATHQVPYLSIVNPPAWELAHIAWFQEWWCRRGGRNTLPSLLPDADRFFDSSKVPHATRWHLDMPPWPVLHAYMQDSLDDTVERLRTAPDPSLYFFQLALLHEDMHGEALAMTLQTLALPAPPGTHAPCAQPAPAARDVAFPGGDFAMGTSPQSKRFAFDNEKWAHQVRVGPFDMRATLVTQGEFREFVDDGGYARDALWDDAGRQWRDARHATAPLNWRVQDADWEVRRFDRWEPLAGDAPVAHVTCHEAQAYCRWAGRRLPTEAQWEYAARNGGRVDAFPWGEESRAGAGLDLVHHAAGQFADPSPSRSGMRQLIGTLWEWTSSPFQAYPGFSPDPYEDYSKPWFGDHVVLRGGSFATRSRLVHNRFRNFYRPDRNDVFAGFRTCAES